MEADPRDNPTYRAAMEANKRLMEERGEKVHTEAEMADKFGNPARTPGMSALDETANSMGFKTIEDMLKACEAARPVDDYQQQVLNAMKTRETYIVLLFGPGHGQTMRLAGPPADEIVWQEAVEPVFYASDAGPDELLRDARRGMHRYRLDDEMESAQMEECAIYVHHEKCCDKRFDRDSNSARRGNRPPDDVFNQPWLKHRRY